MLVWTQQATNFHDRKRNSQAKGKEVDLAEQSKAIDGRPQLLSTMVVKIKMDDI